MNNTPLESMLLYVKLYVTLLKGIENKGTYGGFGK